jgi:threonine dehydrogenase-like Zn-dependent dehydrogenase
MKAFVYRGPQGVDTVIEAVGIPATFELCEQLVAPGGTIANAGVHGVKVDLNLQVLWDRNITITTSWWIPSVRRCCSTACGRTRSIRSC